MHKAESSLTRVLVKGYLEEIIQVLIQVDLQRALNVLRNTAVNLSRACDPSLSSMSNPEQASQNSCQW